MRAALVLLAMIAAGGCYRTQYFNLHLPAAEAQNPVATRTEPSGWQHYFLFGWVPSERVYDSDAACGPQASVSEIRTQRTFLEGVVEQVSNVYGVNIYSPYDAEIFCVPRPQAVAAGTPVDSQ